MRNTTTLDTFYLKALSMMIAIVPVIGALLGVLVYALASNSKVSTLGLVIFGASMVAIMFMLTGTTIHIGR